MKEPMFWPTAEIYDPARLVADVLKGLCSSEQASEICLFQDEITSTLLSPISHYLDVAVRIVKNQTFSQWYKYQAFRHLWRLHKFEIFANILTFTEFYINVAVCNLLLLFLNAYLMH